MKIDPYKHKERYLKWKQSIQNNKTLKGLSKTNSTFIINYIFDMENGLNVANSAKKGGRSYARLNNLKQRLSFIISKIEERFSLEDISQIEERQLFSFFNDMRNGILLKKDGKPYMSTHDYVKVFKAFWHWHMKVNRKLGKDIRDLTLDLDSNPSSKPQWVYLDEKQIKEMIDNAKPLYQTLITFLFDTGIRAPTELINIRVSDLSPDCKELNIRDEISKTFGRKIKLMLSSKLLKTHIRVNKLQKEDQVFPISPDRINQYLKRLATRVFGDKVSLAGQKYSQLSMYDFRHCSCCYWLPRYKSESALKYRFGWKKSDKIHYYSEMLGMKDTIKEEDLYLEGDKEERDNELKSTKAENNIMAERIEMLENQMKQILALVGNLEQTIHLS